MDTRRPSLRSSRALFAGLALALIAGSAADPSPARAQEPAATCEAQIEAAQLPAPSPRMRRYLRGLPEVALYTRLEPALYLRWPEAGDGSRARALREALERDGHPRRALRTLLEAHKDERPLLRGALLQEGYLFAERPALARTLSSGLSLEALFEEPTIHRLRGGRIEALRRAEDRYLAPDGTRATLRLNDRVAVTAEELASPLHLDLGHLRRQSGALRTLPIGVGEEAASFALIFPDGSRRPALVELRDGGTELRCVGGDPSTLEATIAHAATFWSRHARVVAAARSLVRESPRFDEPLDEPEGVQEDGQLRRAWWQAYRSGEETFTYREVAYPVYDREGHPIPPEVCIDFVFDSWERSAGTWYQERGSRPERASGRIDFSRVEGLPRRSIVQLLAFSAEEGSPLERYDVPRRDRVALRDRGAFSRALARLGGDLREGDALIIHGLREQDMRLHYHALLVLETEPISGAPMLVADNQGRPRLRSLVGAMQAAPLRAIKHRLRPDFEALSEPALAPAEAAR